MSEDRQGWHDRAESQPQPETTSTSVTVLVACRRLERACALLHALQATRVQGTPVAGDAISLSRVTTCLAAASPDVLLLEHDPADAVSRRLLARVVRLRGTRILLLCDDCTEQSVPGLLRLGVAGCVPSGDPGQLARAVRGVHAGQCWFPRDVLVSALRRRVAGESCRADDERMEQRSLTPREREVITLVGCGYSNKEIARLLQISHATVQTQLHRVYVKLQTSGRYKAYAAFNSQRADAAPPTAN